jgi:hypothetical protein
MANPLDVLPDFENVVYAHIKRPTAAKLIAWSKAEEAERRKIFYEFIEISTDPAFPKRQILNDALAAFLLTFEAAVQHAKAESQRLTAGFRFDDWLRSQHEYNVLFRGLRTLRHLQAHVEAYSVAGHRVVILNNLPASYTRWSLQKLTQYDLDRLDFGQLKPEHLVEWANLVDSGNTLGLIGEGLDRLNTILARLEPVIFP